VTEIKTDKKPLAGKVAIVTGASRGVGKAISIQLAQNGATVLLAATNPDKLQETAQLITSAGGTAESIVTDLRDETSIKRLVAAAAQRFGRLDILVNNAGVAYAGPIEDTATEQWDRCHSVNARGAFILCREALALLKKAKKAYIINIGSVVSVKGYPLQTAYTASKHALRGFTIALAEELKNTTIRVHIICPGGVATDMVGQTRPDLKQADLMQPGEIAELVVYLVTHEGNAVIDEVHIRRAGSGPWF